MMDCAAFEVIDSQARIEILKALNTSSTLMHVQLNGLIFHIRDAQAEHASVSYIYHAMHSTSTGMSCPDA